MIAKRFFNMLFLLNPQEKGLHGKIRRALGLLFNGRHNHSVYGGPAVGAGAASEPNGHLVPRFGAGLAEVAMSAGQEGHLRRIVIAHTASQILVFSFNVIYELINCRIFNLVLSLRDFILVQSYA